MQLMLYCQSARREQLKKMKLFGLLADLLELSWRTFPEIFRSFAYTQNHLSDSANITSTGFPFAFSIIMVDEMMGPADTREVSSQSEATFFHLFWGPKQFRSNSTAYTLILHPVAFSTWVPQFIFFSPST